MGTLDSILLAGTTAWLSYVLVHKDGPHKILQSFRIFVGNHLGSNSPLGCVFCTSFWVLLILVGAYSLNLGVIQSVITFFGVLGVAAVFYGGYNR